MTPVDRQVAERVRAFHGGEDAPVVRFLLAHVPEGGGTEQPREGILERNVYDQSLPPSVTARATGPATRA